MSTGTRLLAFAGLVAAVFATAAFAGGLVDPETEDQATAHREAAPEAGDSEGGGHGNSSSEQGEAPTAGAPGLAVSQAGYTLELATTALPRGRDSELRFRILGPDGGVLRDFDVESAKRMHLILARTDLSGFQHLHPEQRADGSWVSSVRVPDAGSYRIFADFSSGGDKRTLGANVTVDGPLDARALPSPTGVDEADGYRVRLESPHLRAGEESELAFDVTRGGAPVDVQPYLDARGHLVALRAGDSAYLHVHPHEDELSFEAEFPTAGSYRLFLQFRAAGRVRTVAYTVEVAR